MNSKQPAMPATGRDTVRRNTIWRNADFSLLTGGRLVSQAGNQLQLLALPLLVLGLTGSTSQAGLILAVSTATYLTAGLVAGALADRWDRKRTMIRCEIARAALTATVPIAVAWHAVTMPQLYAVAVLTGVLAVLFQAANSSALPHVVPAARLPEALAATQAVGSALGTVGSSIAGAAYALGRAVPFALDAVSFLVSAATLRAIRVPFRDTDAADRPVGGTGGRELLQEIREGLAWLGRQRVIRMMTVVEAADGFRYGAGYLLIIELARRVGAGSLQVGFVFTGAAVGGLLGGLVSGRIAARWAVGSVMIVMLWTEAASFPLYAVAPSWVFLAAVALLESVLSPIYRVAMDSYRLAITPDRMRGRVDSALGTLVTGATALGTAVGGVLLARISAPALTLGCAGWLLALAVVTTAGRTLRSATADGPASSADAFGAAPVTEREGASA